ncbi:hypothetical protein DFP92_101256 [Yoonia sediminilitoris]|uniref:Uncharacterized protein n=1 Tax=Yoonia sediminilitoris TaxID=1286148 RepID=A0A2T6KQ33_9RHOB|nr:hypothetical protein C8N45_101256 [Yoonia sediminilitoris]RCW98839.1 hypothetical protein DFP92_101256 [Yoonia sediminilitoris]
MSLEIESVKIQLKQELGYLWGGGICGFALRLFSGKVLPTTQRSKKQTVVTCHYRYPSPNRSAFAQGGPVSLFRSFCRKCRFDIGYQVRFTIEYITRSAISGALSHIIMGKTKCKRNQSSSRQLQFSAWPAVWIQTLSAASQAQARVLWQQMFWALILLARPLPVLPWAYCATTQASAAQHAKITAQNGRQNQLNRRRGASPAAVFCLGDG